MASGRWCCACHVLTLSHGCNRGRHAEMAPGWYLMILCCCRLGRVKRVCTQKGMRLCTGHGFGGRERVGGSAGLAHARGCAQTARAFSFFEPVQYGMRAGMMCCACHIADQPADPAVHLLCTCRAIIRAQMARWVQQETAGQFAWT